MDVLWRSRKPLGPSGVGYGTPAAYPDQIFTTSPQPPQPKKTNRVGVALWPPLGWFGAPVQAYGAPCVYYIYNEIRVCPRLGAARADPPLSRMYPQGQYCLGADLAGTAPLTED